jgi:hypothetical protein
MALHRYLDADGNQVPSVTTVLKVIDKPGLLHWAFKRGVEEGRKAGPKGVVGDLYDNTDAADAGTLAHAMIDNVIRGHDMFFELEIMLKFLPEPVVQSALKAVEAFDEWREQVDFEVVATEVSLVCDVLKVGGTVDCIARAGRKSNRRLTVADWKTSKGIWPDYFPQVAAYAYLWQNGRLNYTDQAAPVTLGEPVVQGLALRLGKKHANFAHHSVPASAMAVGLRAFNNALALSRDMAELKEIAG